MKIVDINAPRGKSGPKKEIVALMDEAAIDAGETPPSERPPSVDGATLDKVVSQLAATKPFAWTSCLGDVGQIIEDWREAIIDDLGGDDEVTAMQRIVVDAAIRTQVILDVLDQYILNPSDQKIIDVKNGSAHFIIIQRKMYSDSLVRYMQVLGLQRRKKPKQVGKVIEELVRAAENDFNRETLEAAREEVIDVEAEAASTEEPGFFADDSDGDSSDDLGDACEIDDSDPEAFGPTSSIPQSNSNDDD